MTLATVTDAEEPNPKGHELTRVDGRVKDPGSNLPFRLTAYERYVKYGRLPKKKNARKRVGKRLRKNVASMTAADMVRNIDRAELSSTKKGVGGKWP